MASTLRPHRVWTEQAPKRYWSAIGGPDTEGSDPSSTHLEFAVALVPSVNLQRPESPNKRAPVPRGSPILLEPARPHIDKLGESQRALARAARDLQFADSQVTILSRHVAGLDERRDTLVEQVLNAKSQASVQKSSGGQATLLRIARQRAQELREFDERFGCQWGQLAAARQDLTARRSHLWVTKKWVASLEEATGRLSPVPAQAEYEVGALPSLNPTGALHRGSSNGHGVSCSHDGAEVALSEGRQSATHARPKRAARRNGIGAMIRRRVRRIRRPRRTRPGRIVRIRRQ